MQTEISGAFAYFYVKAEYSTFGAKLNRPVGSQGSKPLITRVAKEGFAGARVPPIQFVEQLLVSAIVFSAKKAKKIIWSRVDVYRIAVMSKGNYGAKVTKPRSLVAQFIKKKSTAFGIVLVMIKSFYVTKFLETF